MDKPARRAGLSCLTAIAMLACMPMAHGKACTPGDAAAADAAVDHLDSWAAVNRAFVRYGHCDDGSIAEGNSEAIARLLVDHWDTLPKLDALVRRDPRFKAYVLRHVDSTLDSGDLDAIARLAAHSCPARTKALCGQLGKAALSAEK